MTARIPARAVPGVVVLAGAAVAALRGASLGLVVGLVALATVALGLGGVLALRPRRRAPWLIVSVAAALWAAAFLVTGLGGGGQPWTVIGFAAHVAAFFALSAALLAFTRGRTVDARVAATDAAIVVAGAGLLVLVVFVEPALAGLPEVPAEVVVATGVGGLAVLGAFAFALAGSVNRGPAWRWVLGGSLAMVVAQIMIAVYMVTVPRDDVASAALVLFALGLLAFGVAAQLPSMRTVSTGRAAAEVRAGLGRVLLLSIAALVGPALIAVERLAGQSLHIWEALSGSTLVIALAMTRTALMLRRLQAQADQLALLAETDPVTRLGNRRRLVQVIDQALARPMARGAVVLLDLERFTELRDSLGSRAADALLREVAARLVRAGGPDATVVRIGSAVFGLLLPSVRSGEHAIGSARVLLAACDAPLVLESITLEVEASAGVVLLTEDGRTAEELLARADVALRVAGDDPARVVRFSPDAGRTAALAPVLVADLPRALSQGEVIAFYQPQVDLGTGRVTGVEALVRWQHPVHGLLAPAAFVPAAERTGLIVRVTRHVLDRALRQQVVWRADGLDLTVAVNLSVHDVLDPGLVEHVRTSLERHGVPPQRLELEITETMAMVDPRRAAVTMAGLADLGVVLAVDDFGTGYSSLAYLRSLPVQRLKIDRTFVAELGADPASQAIVASTVDLAGRLGLEVVAEGVEDDATAVLLTELGCHTAQGFGLSRPVPAGELAAVVQALEGRAAAVPAPRRRTAGTGR